MTQVRWTYGLMKADGEGRLRPLTEDCAFELALCA